MITLAELTLVFRRVFSSRDLVLSEETTAKDVKGWDSLKHITLMTTIEKEYGVRFTTREILDLKNVGELLEIINLRKK